jgi:hypothetical protein
VSWPRLPALDTGSFTSSVSPVYGLRGGVDAVRKALAEASSERPAAFRA